MVGTFGFGTVTPPIYTDPVNTVGVSTSPLRAFYFCRKGSPLSRSTLHRELTAKSSVCKVMLTLRSFTHAFGNGSVKASLTARLGICTKTGGPSPVCLCPRRFLSNSVTETLYIICGNIIWSAAAVSHPNVKGEKKQVNRPAGGELCTFTPHSCIRVCCFASPDRIAWDKRKIQYHSEIVPNTLQRL